MDGVRTDEHIDQQRESAELQPLNALNKPEHPADSGQKEQPSPPRLEPGEPVHGAA